MVYMNTCVHARVNKHLSACPQWGFRIVLLLIWEVWHYKGGPQKLPLSKIESNFLVNISFIRHCLILFLLCCVGLKQVERSLMCRLRLWPRIICSIELNTWLGSVIYRSRHSSQLLSIMLCDFHHCHCYFFAGMSFRLSPVGFPYEAPRTPWCCFACAVYLWNSLPQPLSVKTNSNPKLGKLNSNLFNPGWLNSVPH